MHLNVWSLIWKKKHLNLVKMGFVICYYADKFMPDLNKMSSKWPLRLRLHISIRLRQYSMAHCSISAGISA